MKKDFNTPDDFYKNAMEQVYQVIGNKLKVLGVDSTELPYLVNEGLLVRYTSDEVDGIVLERYDYIGIMLAEFEWTSKGIKQRDIHKDERDFNRSFGTSE